MVHNPGDYVKELNKELRPDLRRPMFDHLTMEQYMQRHEEWGVKSFGPGQRTKGVLNHIRKELDEIEKDPTDPTEWIDLVILAIDGYLRHGGAPSEFMIQLFAKQRRNFNRKWPDWRKMSEDEAIEHVR